MNRKEAPTPPELPNLNFVKWLGSGGYADVYLYKMVSPEMEVAVKVLSVSGMAERVVEQFRAEANTMAQLAGHPYIVQVFRADVTEDGRPYIVMKYYPRPTLGSRSSGREQIPVHEVLKIGIQVSCAVETAHRAGILHRDIKPGNILTDRYGQPGLTDFGIATAKGQSVDSGDALSLPWAPPEIVYGSSPADERSDIYSLGATVWHLLVGHSPFEIPGGDNKTPALMSRIRTEKVPRINRPDVPPELERLLAHTMAKDPLMRPASALEVAKSLQEIEIKQHWSPTPLVVSELEDQITLAPELDDDRKLQREDATMLRGAQRIVAQPPNAMVENPTIQRAPVIRQSEVSSGREAGSANQNSREVIRERGVFPNEVPLPGTVRRTIVGGDEGSTNEVSPPVKKNKSLLPLLVVGVLVILAGVGVFLFSGGKKAASTSSVTTYVATTASNAIVDQIGIPSVTLTRQNSTDLVATWTYSNSATGDVYRIRVNGGQWIQVSKPTYTILDASGQNVCVEVQVQRADGSATSPISASTCGG